MAQSPSSSPRLPSPPPMAEDQIGPTSPGMHKFDDLDGPGPLAAIGQHASRRIRPGTRSEDMLEGPPLVDLADIDSAFQLTEYLKSLFSDLTNPSPSTTVPITRQTALQLSTPPPSVDHGIWLYELCRLLVARTNVVLVSLFSDSPPCSAQTCSEMRASEWQYLCAAHDPPKSCCAIDYCCHTLDWAATQLTSSKLFPSRLALGTENVGSQQQLRKMTEVFRRVYRIFAHAWFQHRDVFWKVEGQTGLYVFFKTVCDEYRLIPEDSYTVPAEAEGSAEEEMGRGRQTEGEGLLQQGGEEQDAGRKDTQKRHHRVAPERQHSISTVIHEAPEEDDDAEDDMGNEDAHRRGVVRELVFHDHEEEVDRPQQREMPIRSVKGHEDQQGEDGGNGAGQAAESTSSHAAEAEPNAERESPPVDQQADDVSADAEDVPSAAAVKSHVTAATADETADENQANDSVAIPASDSAPGPHGAAAAPEATADEGAAEPARQEEAADPTAAATSVAD